MSRLALLFIVLLVSIVPVYGKVVVFWQDGFPTIESQPIARATLLQAFDDKETILAGTTDLKMPGTLKDADLLVLPYGSAVPTVAWQPIREYLLGGGNLLTLGGRPLLVPVTEENGRFVAGRAQNTYSRQVGIDHSYEVPQKNWVRISQDEADLKGARFIFLNFDPEPGYWDSTAGIALIKAAGRRARQRATFLHIELMDVGHDEGGVANRLLNQFYGDAGVAFPTNHTWWRDDALLWDSVVAKRPDMPNLVGETSVEDPGILICPTDVGNATLYVLTSESASLQTVTFKDGASGKSLSGRLEPGRAALILVGKSGELLADYNWNPLP